MKDLNDLVAVIEELYFLFSVDSRGQNMHFGHIRQVSCAYLINAARLLIPARVTYITGKSHVTGGVLYL